MTEAADAGMGSDDLAGPLKSYQWWLTTFPGLAVLSVVLGFNFLGDGLRDAFDPRLRGA
jgi:peptide/nickel transport system permease protein